MKVRINDTAIDLPGSSATLEQVVHHHGVTDVKGLAVAVNSTVIPRTNWSAFQLTENDTIIIIRATQGG
jgi:sulfur carrier protein